MIRAGQKAARSLVRTRVFSEPTKARNANNRRSGKPETIYRSCFLNCHALTETITKAITASASNCG
jgi:hypothetical protein